MHEGNKAVSFSAIKDQDVAVRLLRGIVKQHRIPNGMLFWGPSGVGKRLAAFETAKAIQCAQDNGDACDGCLSCRKITHGNHPDILLVEPASKTRIFKKENMEFITDMACYRPFEGKWRVFIILEADRMNPTAQNYFLKTLEEPPSNTLFILVTEQPRMLLPTIRSRCQPVRFGTLRPETVRELLLRDRDLSPADADAVAAVSQGQMSRALDLVETRKRDVVIDLARRLRDGEDPLDLSEFFAQHVREQEEALKVRVRAEMNPEELEQLTPDEREEIEEKQDAYIQGLIRQHLMEYLYLFKIWYRDEGVFAATQDPDRVLYRDQLDMLKAGGRGDMNAKLSAIETAWVYLERNLKRERVFRDLFFVLAS